MRFYEPQPWIHQADCTDAPSGLPRFRARATGDMYPYGRPHHCFDSQAIVFNRDCVAEFLTYEPHQFVRSTIWPRDATGPLCHVCRGSHPESGIVAMTTPRRPQ